MKRKTRTVMPRRTAPKLRKPAISESEADTNEPSSALSPLPAARKGAIAKLRRSATTDASERNPRSRTNDCSPVKDPLTVRVPEKWTRRTVSEKDNMALAGEGADDIPTSPMVNSKTSRSLVKDSVTNGASNALGVTMPSGNKIVDDLKAKFDQLSMLRTTAAELLLAEYKASAEKRIIAAEGMIEALRRENEMLKKQQQKNQDSPPESVNRSASTGRISDVSTLSRTDDSSNRSLVDFYCSLSGLQVVLDEGNPHCWHCSLGGRQGGFTFDLRSAQDGSQYEYQPTFNLNSSMASRLPAYLQEEIVFDADQLQLFFWRALNFLMTLPTK